MVLSSSPKKTHVVVLDKSVNYRLHYALSVDNKEILQYQTREGKAPYREWLLSLKDATVKARIRTRLDRLRLGNFGDCKGIGEGVSELRLQFGPGYRIYFGQDSRSIVILLCGGDKSTQVKDIRLAQEHWEDYKRRSSK